LIIPNVFPVILNIYLICATAINKELKWAFSITDPRLILNKKDKAKARSILNDRVIDKSNSNIVRVNVLQGLFDLTENKTYQHDLFTELQKERIPAISRRTRKLRSKL